MRLDLFNLARKSISQNAELILLIFFDYSEALNVQLFSPSGLTTSDYRIFYNQIPLMTFNTVWKQLLIRKSEIC